VTVVAIAAAQSAERVIKGFVYAAPTAVTADAHISLHCARIRLADARTATNFEVLMMDGNIQCMEF